jgi:hypothetical protein
VSGVTRRPWLVPAVATLAAVAFFVAGVVAWRMTGVPPEGHFKCPPNALCGTSIVPDLPHRLHPLQAELLWAASALLALVGVGTGLRVWRRPSPAQPVSG